MDIFDVQPQLKGIAEEYGPEPSLRSVLIHYYGQVLGMDAAIAHAELYIAALKSKINN